MRNVLIGICVLSLEVACSGGDPLLTATGPTSGSASGGSASGAAASGAAASGAAASGAAASGSASGTSATPTSGVATSGSASGSSTAGTSSGSHSSGDGGAGQLPCDIASFLQSACQSCHSSPPIGGAPMPLITYADLTGPALTDPTQTVAQMCVSRMQNTSRPMPPTGLTAASMTAAASLQSWIAAGYPVGTCGTAGGSDAGVSAPNPYSTPVTCTSGTTYSGGEGSSAMDPGQACISCHSANGGPSFVIGGTVYPTAHEPNNCNGANGSSDGATVVITDSTGKVFTLNVNSSGNFYESTRSATIAMPFQAKVVQGGNERVMATPQSTGDCNSCHTETGASNAPGRIMLP